MRRRLILMIIMIIAFTLGLVGCGNSIVKKSIEQAKIEIESKEYDKALASLQLALDEDKDHEEANKLYSIVDEYQKAKKLVDENKIDEAKKVLDEIDTEYVNYGIKEDIDSLKQQVEDKIKESELINSNLAKLLNLVDEKKYDEANALFEEINKSSLNEEQKSKANELKARIDSELAEVEAKKRAEEERVKLEESRKSITEEKAIELVRSYLINKGSYVPGRFMIESGTDTEYNIRAYDDMGNHTATSGWYIVNKSTGNVKSMF